MPLNSLMPVLAMPCTLPEVVSTTQKSCPPALPARPAAGRGGGGVACCASTTVEPRAEAAIKQEDCFKNPRRLRWEEFIRLAPLCNRVVILKLKFQISS